MGKTIQKSWIRPATITQVSRVFSIQRGIPYINTKYKLQGESPTPMEYVFGGIFKSGLLLLNLNRDLVNTIDNPIKDPSEILSSLFMRNVWIEIHRKDYKGHYWYHADLTTEPLWD